MIEIGKIVTTRGLKGELKILPLTNVATMFDDLDSVYIDGVSKKIELVKHIKNCVSLKLEGINSPEDAALYIHKTVKIEDRDLKPLKKDEYYIKDLIGLTVKNADSGEVSGTVKDIIITGSNDVLDIEAADKKQILVPMVKEFVKEIDMKNKVVLVHFIEGMID